MKGIILSLVLISGILTSNKVLSQSEVPLNVTSIVNLNLEDAQKVLGEKGYEIAGSNFFKKTQLWWNETDKVCISLSYNKGKEHKVESVKQGEAASCKSGVEAARKVWEKYHDGPAPVNSPGIEKERQKLSAKGYVVSYWIEDIAPGRSTEYWKSESNECMHIVWNTLDKSDVSVSDCEAKYSVNPAPKK